MCNGYYLAYNRIRSYYFGGSLAKVMEMVKRERSRRHPAIALERAVSLVQRIQTQIGFQAASREIIAEAMGHGGLTGPAASKIAALLYFDLLVKEGPRVRIAPLGRQILVPTSEGEKAEALVEAVKAPSLYRELIDRYSEAPLPGLLTNLLMRDFGIAGKRGAEVEKVFRASVEYAGLLRNGILYADIDEAAEGTEPETWQTSEQEDPPSPEEGTIGSGREPVAGEREHVIPLESGNGSIRLPDPLTKKDLLRVEKWAALMGQLLE